MDTISNAKPMASLDAAGDQVGDGLAIMIGADPSQVGLALNLRVYVRLREGLFQVIANTKNADPIQVTVYYPNAPNRVVAVCAVPGAQGWMIEAQFVNADSGLPASNGRCNIVLSSRGAAVTPTPLTVTSA